MAARRRAGQPGRVDHHDGAAQGDRPATPRPQSRRPHRTGCRSWPTATPLRTTTEPGDSAVGDDRLRLLFTCCHPALALEARVALTLKSLGGLTTAEVARAFLTGEATMAQRLVRAKRKIAIARIPYRVPAGEDVAERLAGVLHVIYLVFNEGYSAAAGDRLVRGELCAEAIRLGRLLVALMPDEPEAHGLLALMLLQDARRDARVDPTAATSRCPTRTPRAGIRDGSPRASTRCAAQPPVRTGCRPRSPPFIAIRRRTGAPSPASMDA